MKCFSFIILGCSRQVLLLEYPQSFDGRKLRQLSALIEASVLLQSIRLKLSLLTSDIFSDDKAEVRGQDSEFLAWLQLLMICFKDSVDPAGDRVKACAPTSGLFSFIWIRHSFLLDSKIPELFCQVLSIIEVVNVIGYCELSQEFIQVSRANTLFSRFFSCPMESGFRSLALVL